MHGHQLYLVALLGNIAVAEKRDVGKVMLHCALLAAARLVFVDRLLELSQIVEPLLTALGAQRLFIAAFVQNVRKHLGNRAALIRVRKALDQVDKLSCLRAAEHTVLQMIFERCVETCPLFFRRLLQKGHAPLAEVPLGHIGDATERQIILIGDHAQV